MRPGSRFPTRVRAFGRDESGQSLVFAALTFFVMVVVALIVVGVGEATTAQMEVQHAADAGAYGGALVLSDCVSQIAWTNEAMAHVYYHAMRYAVDTATTGVLAELKTHPPQYGRGTLFPQHIIPSDDVVGINDPVARYDEAYQRADEWIPRAEAWLRRLSRLQRGIAVLAPEAIMNQAYYTAFENGAERVAFYPEAIELIPQGPTQAACDIERIVEEGSGLQGWHIYSALAGTRPFDFTAVHNPDPPNPHDPHFPPGDPDDLWRIDYFEGQDIDMHMDVYRYDLDTPGTYPLQYAIRQLTPDGEVRYYIVFVRDEETVTVIDQGEETTIRATEGENGTEYEIDDGGDVSRIRQTPEGDMEYWDDEDGDGQVDEDEWQSLDPETEVDGVSLPVEWTPVVDTPSGEVTIDDPMHIHLERVTLRVPLYIHTPPDMETRVWYHTPAGTVHVHHNENTGEYWAAINGLNTRSPSVQWLRRWSGDDRNYHRLFLLSEAEGEELTGPWRYERVRIGSFMTDMDMRHFAVHAIMDHDEGYASAPLSRGWEGHYFGPTDEDDELWASAPQQSRWRHFPRWAQPPRWGADEGPEDGNYGGWFDIQNGRPRTYQGQQTAYNQSRECWYCGHRGDVSGSLHDYDSQSPTFGRTCVRPCGFWHEIYPTDAEARDRVYALNVAWQAAGHSGRSAPNPVELGPGRFLVQVTCPVCARKLRYRELAYGPPVLTGEANQVAERLSHRASVVRKYLAHALGQHTEPPPDGPYQTRRIEPEDRVSVAGPAGRNPDRWQPPLAATAELFRRGVTVGAWKTSVEARLYQGLGAREPTEAQRRRGLYNPFPREEEAAPTRAEWSEVSGEERLWGHFGIATARLVFWNEMNEAGALERARKFPGAGFQDAWRPAWITEPEEAIDPLGRPVNWFRETWLRSQMNLFEPDWDAALVSTREAFDMRDVQFLHTHGGYGLPGERQETTVSFLFYELGERPWWPSVVDRHRHRHAGRAWTGRRRLAWDVSGHWNHMGAPPMQGQRSGRSVAVRDPDMERVVRH